MRGLFLRIFAIFWLAQSLIFIISTSLIVRQRFPSQSTVSDALDSNLQHDADLAFTAFTAGGCAAFADNGARHEPGGAILLDRSAHTVCTTSNPPIIDGIIPRFQNRLEGRQIDGHEIWLVPETAKDGTVYEYVWGQPPVSPRRPQPPRRYNLLRYAFPQLPVAIAIGGLTTFVLVLLFSRPLVRLRRAARQLAAGNLSTRVEESPKSVFRPQSDEFQGLVHDFNHMAERLESLVGAQRLLLRDVSHELRSPLSRLSVALELAREDSTPELEQHLARMEREGERLNQLIGQLLTLSSMETREGTANFRPVSLNRLCEQILPDAEYEAQRRPCTVLLQQDSDCTILGDSELIYRAIENVVRNAIRYTAPGTQVTIRVAQSLIEVTDSGPGIPEEELTQIFQPFYRVDKARSSSTGGFGVGLAIAERAVRLHGGTLRAANRHEGGMSIQMLFPHSPAR